MTKTIVQYLLWVSLMCLSALVQAQSIDIPIVLSPGDLSLEATAYGATRIRLPGYSPSGMPEAPALPARVVRLALPANTDLSSVAIEVISQSAPIEIPLRGRPLERRPPLRLLCGPSCGGGKTLQLHRQDLSGAGAVQPLPSGSLGPIGVAGFVHRPVWLDEGQDRLFFYPRQVVRVTFQSVKDRSIGSQWLPPRLISLAAQLVINPEQLPPFPRTLGDEETTPGVAVVTTQWFAEQSEVLPAYLESLTRRGFQPTLVTEEQFDAVEGPPPNERPQKIRTWLQQNYQQLNLQHVLLLGNPDPVYGDLPMLAAFPFAPGTSEYVSDTPTDAYFADLTGNWDLDGDGVYGEAFDDNGPGGVDFYPELSVGRIPIYGDAKVADQLLDRSIRYASQKGDSGWRRKILFPGAMLFFKDQEQMGTPQEEGGDMVEYMKPEFLQSGYNVTTMYEQKGFVHSIYTSDYPLTENDLIKEWNKGYGLVFWFGHGSEDAAWRTIWLEDPNHDNIPQAEEITSEPFAQSIHFAELSGDKPSFLFHGSCSNGTPETASNIGYTMLKSGAISTFSSTRVAFGPAGPGWVPNPASAGIFDFGYYVMSKIKDGKSSGQAIGETRALMVDDWWGVDYSWHTKLATSLYGDPTLTISNCKTDSDCDDGLGCNGQERCDAGFCQGGTPMDCTDLDTDCSRGSCNEETDRCEAVSQDGKACSDGLFCTVADQCQDGVCRGTPLACTPEVQPCIVGECDEEAKACVAKRVDDGQECDLEGKPGECRAGLCVEKKPTPKPEHPGCSSTSGLFGSSSLFWGVACWLLARNKRRRADPVR